MQAGDKVQIISGEHRGRTGVAVTERRTEAVGVPEGEKEIGWWLIVFPDGSADFHESEIEVIETK